jgi:hypothetical protein
MTELDLDRWNIDFSVAKCMRYHTYRRSFWESFDYWTKIFVLISGTAVIGAIISNTHTWWSEIAAGTVAVLTIMDIVLDFGGRARAHSDLYRSFCHLAKEIAENITPTALDISKWKATART